MFTLVMMTQMRYNLNLTKVNMMPNHFKCDGTQYQSVPIRPIMRLYMLFSGVSLNEALNCGEKADFELDSNIGIHLKSAMNRLKSDGLDIETGRVNYQALASSSIFDEYLKLVATLQQFDPGLLNTNNDRKAFWINIYNVMTIHGVIAYQAKNSIEEIRGTFERIAYIIGGLRYSLDDIEHGVLRANLGHIAIPGRRFRDDDPRRQNVVDEFDPRIHFTLVCGAMSCPPIGIYQAEKLDLQMDMATKNFINNGGVVLNKDKMSVSLSRIFQWYSPDFGGGWMGLGSKAPVIRYISQFVIDKADAQFLMDYAENLNVRYQTYDWSLNV